MTAFNLKWIVKAALLQRFKRAFLPVLIKHDDIHKLSVCVETREDMNKSVTPTLFRFID